mmetsp:Transcript_13912/g.16387  ORF Transcript_13912/g.16387 Transcript_13912/m.16387 type:complete len:102 (-) Transcript_13912:311-616(-)
MSNIRNNDDNYNNGDTKGAPHQLDVNEQASLPTIILAYRSLALKYHPNNDQTQRCRRHHHHHHHQHRRPMLLLRLPIINLLQNPHWQQLKMAIREEHRLLL